MTPFADLLFHLRRSRGLRQRELADRLGLGASYISALEACRKDPPAPKQLARLSTALALSPEESGELIRVAELSRSRIDIPSDASKDEYVLMHELARKLGSLTAEQVSVMRTVLRMSREDTTARTNAASDVKKESVM